MASLKTHLDSQPSRLVFPRACAFVAVLICAGPLAFAEVALQFGGSDLVTTRTNLLPMTGRGVLDTSVMISPTEGYRGPAFTGGYGRSNNGSVDAAEIRDNHGPYQMDMLGFTEGGMGNVDRIYGLISFPSSSFSRRAVGNLIGVSGNDSVSIRLARAYAFSIRTYTGFLPDQEGWLYFYVESNGQGFLSPPYSYTRDVDDVWGEKNITLSDPRTVTWSRFATVGNSPELARNRPPGTPDLDKVTAVGFYFETHVNGGNKNTARFFTDFFLVNAEVE